MMLVTTLNVELGHLDHMISQTSRRRFAALSKCDHITAKTLWEQMAKLNEQRLELLGGPPLIPYANG